MNLLRFQNLKTVSRLVVHRILKPFIWEHVTRPRLTRLSDEDFLSRCGFQGSADDFIASFHPKARLRFFFHPRNQKDFFLNLLTRTQNHEDILAESEDVLRNKFQTLGSAKTSLGESINWHRDFKSGKVWPLDSGKKLDLLDLGNSSDVKVPWELSRFHQVWWLGKAYWLTRNEQYPKKFAELVESWIENNPPGKGVNWSVAMEVAIRAANWIAGYYFFCESPSLTPSFWLRFLKSLHVHGNFIENHLEYSWRTSNHFLSDVVGLIFLGIFFQDAEFGKRWLSWAVPSLQEEMDQEVYPDGVDYEKSTSYQRLVLELFYTAAILCKRNKISLSSSFMQRLQNMFDFVL
ncbi:MAG: Hepar II III N domain-containing protein, partial [Bacteroidetes bacterium]|nr:Hepar II III N domain-containing protein [Bacteroidota bacterium]